MYKLLFFLFFTTFAYASTDLKEIMQGTCEDLGATQGAKCVELQRKLESNNSYMDKNGASICQLIWQWGSRSGNAQATGDLVLSCLKQVADLKISDEVKDTCNRTVYVDQGSIVPMHTVTEKVESMMSCLRKIGIPTHKPSMRKK